MISWINIAKALGIISIVMGHSHAPINIYQYFYYFHIPLFFFLSGYLFNKEQPKFKIFIKNKFLAYMVPYFIYGFVFTLLMILLLSVRSLLTVEDIILFIRGYLFGQIAYMVNQNLWFLPSLFLTTIFGFFSIIFLDLKLSIKNNLLFITIVLIGIYLSNNMRNYFMSITTIPVALLFFYFGFHYKSFEDLDNWKNPLLLLGFFIGILIVYFISYNYFDQVLDVGNTRIRPSIILMIVNGLLGIYLVIKVSKYIQGNSMLEFIGKISLYIFMFHQMFVPIINYIYNMLSINEIWYITGLVKIFLSILLYTMLIKPIKLTKYGKFL